MLESLTSQQAHAFVRDYGSPLYVYDKQWLKERAKQLLEACKIAGCKPRYAIKANPHPEVIKLFDGLGLYFDASSDYEANRLIKLGIDPTKISLSSQQPPQDMKYVLESGVQFVATSLHQLALVQGTGWKGSLAVRINPGMGAGQNNKTTTGGISASFGMWHEYIPQIRGWQNKSGCTINRLHIHIGSGADPNIWRDVIKQGLEITKQFPDIVALDIGGGYKVARMEGEPETDMSAVMQVFDEELTSFKRNTGRELSLEVEPGTWLVANSGTLLSKIVDIVDTGEKGYTFIKLDTGMNDILRPTLYGAQHSIRVLNSSVNQKEYVVVGHNCESGDLLTPESGDPEIIKPRLLREAAIGDIVAIGGTGAYSASMRAHGYNDFPSAKEILL